MNATSIFLGLLIVLFIILAAPLEAQGETTDHRVRITKDVPILWIDYISTESPLLGMRQAFYGGRVLDFKEMTRRLIRS